MLGIKLPRPEEFLNLLLKRHLVSEYTASSYVKSS